MLFLRLIKESIFTALHELWNNKLRTFLSLLGITIGIFAIIAVLSGVDNIERKIRDSVNQLGTNVIFVEKWPWGFSSEYKWWEYLKRPIPKYEEYQALKKKLHSARHVAFKMTIDDEMIKHGNNAIEDIAVEAATPEYGYIFSDMLVFNQGRYFSLMESHRGTNSVILGWEVAQMLFPEDTSLLLKQVKLLGRKFKVVGVLQKKGEDFVSFGTDRSVIIPYQSALKTTKPREGYRPEIIVKGHQNIAVEDVKAETYGVMRSIRRLSPKEEPNFALNQVSLLSNQISSTFQIINIAGWIIGGFAMLVGGFGIANIMFVSVRERTNLIGIKKAIGAKNYIVLLEFLIEAVILCLIGGIMGLFCVFLVMLTANQLLDLTFYLTFSNILLGVTVSVIVGIISGFLPALQASRMDPVEAIRYT